MRNKAINVLLEMGMPANIKGFEYIADAMEFLHENNGLSTGELYRKIAEKNSDMVARVERSIRHAFTSVFKNGNKELVKKYLSFINRTNGNLLRVLYLRLSQEE